MQVVKKNEKWVEDNSKDKERGGGTGEQKRREKNSHNEEGGKETRKYWRR